MKFRRTCLALATALLLPGAASGQADASRVNPRVQAMNDTSLRVIVSIARRHLWVIRGEADTLRSAPAAVGSGRSLTGAGGRTWTFVTPRGVHPVLSKEIDPVWVRPDWAYVEVARSHGLRVEYLDALRPRVLTDGRRLIVQSGVVGILDDAEFSPLPIDEEIVFGRVLFVPPISSENRRMAGELGRYRLNLGDGIGIHGTPHTESIGRSVTHGCLRLGDDDIEWLYVNVPVGTRVYIY